MGCLIRSGLLGKERIWNASLFEATTFKEESKSRNPLLLGANGTGHPLKYAEFLVSRPGSNRNETQLVSLSHEKREHLGGTKARRTMTKIEGPLVLHTGEDEELGELLLTPRAANFVAHSSFCQATKGKEADSFGLIRAN